MRDPRRKIAQNVALVLVACLLLAGSVLAQASTNHDLSWNVIAGGGGRMESTGHTLVGTAGQGMAGTTLAPGPHSLCSGFWCGIPTARQVYLPLVIRS